MPFESFFHSSYRNNLSFAKLIWQNFILKKFDCEAENCKKVVSGYKKSDNDFCGEQCCGSGMFIPDPTFFHPGSDLSIPDPNFFPHPGSTSKNLNILTPKNFLSSRKYDTGCSSRIRNLIFYPSRIRDPQYCRRIIFLFDGESITWGSFLRAFGSGSAVLGFKNGRLGYVFTFFFHEKNVTYFWEECVIFNHEMRTQIF
jgi:hypothetical protein